MTIVRFGLQPAQERRSWAELVDAFQLAEDLGMDTAWLEDHYLPTGAADRLPGDAWALLPALAVKTRTIRLGVLVTCNNFRHPAVLANMAANVDVISGGRLEFGIGAGWFEREHAMLGIPFPPVGERLRRLDEAVQVIKLLWTEQKANFQGQYYRLKDAMMGPKPHQKPHPPIIIGGGGEKSTLRVVARHANEWNLAGTVSEFARKGPILDGYCKEIGRDPKAIKRSVALPMVYTDDIARAHKVVEIVSKRRGISIEEARGRIFHGNADMIEKQIRDFMSQGVAHFIIQEANPEHMQGVVRFAREVMPRFKRR